MPSSKISPDAAASIKQDYQQLLNKAGKILPKVDQKLLLNILYYETMYSDWEGNILLKVVYPAHTDVDKKKEWIYQKYERMASIEEDRTVRFKAIRFYLDDLNALLAEDSDIEYITGSATFTPSEAYSV